MPMRNISSAISFFALLLVITLLALMLACRNGSGETLQPTKTGIVSISEATSTATRVKPTYTPTKIPFPTFSPTPMPSSTPTPTFTPTPPPSSTPSPTATPAPTATHTPMPTPTPSPEKVATAAISKLVPWFAETSDEINEETRTALLELWLMNRSLGVAISSLPWIVDGLSGDEGLYVRWIKDAAAAPESTSTITAYPWVMDGIAERERTAWKFVISAPVIDRELAKELSVKPWLSDGLTAYEIRALYSIERVARVDVELATLIVEAPWLAKRVAYDEQEALDTFARIARKDSEFAERIVTSEWLRDVEQVTSHHTFPLNSMSVLAGRLDLLNRHIVGLVNDGFGRSSDSFLFSMAKIVQEQQDAFDLLTNQSWFQDGINGDESALLTVAWDVLDASLEEFKLMIETRNVLSKSLKLPVSGDVDVWVVSTEPLPSGEAILDEIDNSLQSLERLTRVPLDTSDVVVLMADTDINYELPQGNLETPWFRGAHAETHIRVPISKNGEYTTKVLFHELAHYYFDNYPVWFLEGGAEFATQYIWYLHVADSFGEWGDVLATRPDPVCRNGAQNLHELGPGGFGYIASPEKSCYYTMGEHFLASMFWALGEDVMVSVIHDIVSENRLPSVRPYSPKDVFVAFLRNIPPEQEVEFRAIFRRLHGGPLSQTWNHVGDDHGNSSLTATEMEFEADISGSLEQPFDTDSFKLNATAAKPINVKIDHTIVDDKGFSDLYVQVHPPNGDASRILLDRGPLASTETLWIPQESGEYFFSVDSGKGLIGAYTIRLDLVPTTADPGDSLGDAMDIASGEILTGTIDYGSDTDYFRLPVQIGHGYAATVNAKSALFPKIAVLFSEGGTVSTFKSGSGRAERVFIEWAQPTTGFVYITVESPRGVLGGYTLTVAETVPVIDAEGDDFETAFLVQPFSPIVGALDIPFDTDFFRFPAQSGQTYNIMIEHLTLFPFTVEIFLEDETRKVEDFWFDNVRASGGLIAWTPPETGNYFMKFFHLEGDVGEYRLTIIPGVLGNDDHSDEPSQATELAIDRAVEGQLNHVDDFDYFRFRAEAGEKYEIAIDYDTAEFVVQPFEPFVSGFDIIQALAPERPIENGEPHPLIELFGPDSTNVEAIDANVTPFDLGQRVSGKYIRWTAPTSAEYYVVVWSVQGDAGPYVLTVSQAP